MPFNSALSGLQAASNALKVHGNNIANASTPGFKGSRAEFRDVFASGSLGSSANTIGTGVKLTSVSQQFTQGNIQAAETNLDLSINGSGFFVLDKDGSRLYSRSGAFRVDKDGNIANSQRHKLLGFLTDENNNITGAQGPLTIKNNSIDPKATAAVDVTINLDNREKPPAVQFVPGFTPANPPATSTFNKSASVQVYDSLGNEHIMNMYYVKAPAERTWNVYIGIDGVDATPTAATPPAGGTPSAPAVYPAGQLARPFTLIFDQTGKYVVNNASARASHYGNPPVLGPDPIDYTTLNDSGTLPTLDIGDLTINGVPIAMGTTTDSFSTTDQTASFIAIRDAINTKTAEHKVTASVNATIFDTTGGNFTVDPLVAGDLTINGVQIVGVPAAADCASLVALITAANVPGVVASNNGGQLRLTAADGRNIQLETTGAAAGLSFTNFDTDGGAALDKVKRGQISLTIPNNQGITIAGNNPGDIGLVAGTRAGIFQDNSDLISLTFDPGTGATSPQGVSIDLSSSTQFASAFSITALTQDGYATGRLTGVEVDPEGVITARFGNGKSQQLGQVALANFRNPQGLQAQGDTCWVETFSSGVALLGAPGTSDLGLIQAGSLEDSNVQLTNELVALIVAQRNFQASAQTIRTADAVTQTIINIR